MESEAIRGPACHLSGNMSNDGKHDDIENISATVSQDIAEETRESEAIHGPACHLSADKSDDGRDDNIENIAAASLNIQEKRESEAIHGPACHISADKSNDGRDDNIENIAAVSRDIGSPYGRTKRTRWNENEKTVVLTAFDEFMKGGKLPSLQAIHKVIKQNPCLINRSSPQIKTWLHNQLKKKEINNTIVLIF
ncbi:uncharacterized protein LOC143899546 isoform X2 [Temnothorax americanus]|uniref:uncharacterized protein LOC143899546 isoform X2 n=1 Tax=Temnothorax americanus TaxID=1964332 RepID=UPI0040685213